MAIRAVRNKNRLNSFCYVSGLHYLCSMKKILLAFLACVMASSMNGKTIKLRIVQTSDVHGCFFPYDFVERKPMAGSMARVASYVDSLRACYGKNLILLDNGDILQGQPTSYYYNYIDTTETNIAAQVVNYLGYDAETIGNHDVEPGHAVYDKWISEVKCPVLGANVVDAKTGRPYLKPYTILEREGVRIAILGMLTPAIPNWLGKEVWSGMRFDNMVTSARYWMNFLQENEHPDVVIGLFHSGRQGGIVTSEMEEDASIHVAQAVPGFDLVLFGHDHTAWSGTVKNGEGKSVVCLDPANNAKNVADAEITVTMEGNNVHTQVTGRIVSVARRTIDAKYMAHFKPHTEKVERFVNKKIGTLKRSLYTRDMFFGSSAFGDLIQNMQLKLTGADIAFNAPLLQNAMIAKGPLRVADMFKLYRYENQLCVMRLTGEEIRKHLEMSYDQWVNTMKDSTDHLFLIDTTKTDNQHARFKNYTFNFDSAAGIDYIVDVTRPNGEKVQILRLSNGKPFDEKAIYRVAINSYRANGGGELLTRGAGIAKDSLPNRIEYRSPHDQRYYLMKEIEREKTIDPSPNNNWRFVPESWVKPAAERDYKLIFNPNKK